MRNRPIRGWAPAAILAATAATAAAAPDDDDVRKELDALRRQMADMEARHRAELDDLRRQLAGILTDRAGPPPSALQQQIDDLLDRVDEVDAKVAAAKAPAAPGRAAYLDVSFNALFTAGTSTAQNETIRRLQGGGHDPNRRGVTAQNEEIVLAGAADPYLRGVADVVWSIDPEGETVTELEEAYAQTTSLPAGLQVKAGQYFTEFGRLNPQHPHQWDFVDQPIANTRFFGGDGLRGQGARVSWLAPTPFPLELQLGAQNANGETMTSFLGTEEEEPPFGAHAERTVRTWRDLTTTARVAGGVDLTDEMPFQLGLSRAWGPSGAGESSTAAVEGVDLTLKWRPLANDHGFPFVDLQAEWMRRRFGWGPFVQEGAFVPGGRLNDHGGYAQAVWGFRRNWTAALRWERARGDFAEVFGLDDRTRWSAALTWYTSEFAKLRVQVNRDHVQSLPGRDATSLWLQLEFNLGAHGAHRF